MLSLETSRLIFRRWELDDFDEVSMFFSSDETAEFVGGRKSAEDVWRLIATYAGHYELRGYSYLALEEKATHSLVGTVGIWNSKPWPEPELGYWLLPHMQSKGYGTEAGAAVLAYAFQVLKLPTLVSYIDERNTPSINLARRLGAQLDGKTELLQYGIHSVYRYLAPSTLA